MSDANTYEAPKMDATWSGMPPRREGDIWCDGPFLVVRHGVVLPPPCVRCCREVDGPPIELEFSASLVSSAPKAKVSACFCKSHRERLELLGASAILNLAFVPGIIVWHWAKWSMLWGSVPLVLGRLGMIVKKRGSLGAKKIDPHFIWLKRVHPAYRRAFPPVSNLQSTD
jgi:hypothetical protein